MVRKENRGNRLCRRIPVLFSAPFVRAVTLARNVQYRVLLFLFRQFSQLLQPLSLFTGRNPSQRPFLHHALRGLGFVELISPRANQNAGALHGTRKPTQKRALGLAFFFTNLHHDFTKYEFLRIYEFVHSY